MNRSAIRNLVIEATKRTDKVALINSAIDLAVEEVSSQRLWSDLLVEDEVTLTEDEPSVELASDMARLIEVRLIDDTNSRVLILRNKTWLVNNFPNVSSQTSARPVYGYLEGKTLFLIPIPNSDYTIRYTYCKLHPALATDADEVLIRHAAPVVAAYATFWVFKSLERHVDAKEWLGTYIALLNSAKKVDSDNPAVKIKADIRGSSPGNVGEYWLDPFVRRNP